MQPRPGRLQKSTARKSVSGSVAWSSSSRSKSGSGSERQRSDGSTRQRQRQQQTQLPKPEQHSDWQRSRRQLRLRLPRCWPLPQRRGSASRSASGSCSSNSSSSRDSALQGRQQLWQHRAAAAAQPLSRQQRPQPKQPAGAGRSSLCSRPQQMLTLLHRRRQQKIRSLCRCWRRCLVGQAHRGSQKQRGRQLQAAASCPCQCPCPCPFH